MKKTYKLTVTEEGGRLEINTECDGFTPIELLGILAYKKADILKQMTGDIKPDIITRKFVKEDADSEGITEQGKIRKATYIKPKICENCGNTFYPYRSDAKYCKNASPQNERLTCAEYISRNWYKRKKADSDIFQLYRKIYCRKNMSLRRKPDDAVRQAEFNRYDTESRVWKEEVKAGNKTEAEFKEWLIKENGI